ncbi:recombinase family protein [Streptomyces sp. NPDC091972]|uniref:recombinase family protein n=1 Tax=Streptomyces sp. NPDC091972 TaxID=3366007 RepID=UPI0038157501
MPVYDPQTGKLQNWVEDPLRSIVPKELFRMLEAGVPVSVIAARFAKRGYTNRSGRPFTHAHLRDMAERHSYAGLRVHKGTVYDGTWDAIVPVVRFWNVQRILFAPGRATYRGGGARHELTAGLHCDRCGSLFRVDAANSKTRKPSYKCKAGGCTTIQKELVDDYLIGTREEPGAMMAYLARPDLHELLAAPEADADELRDVQARLAEERAELAKMEHATPTTLAAVEILGRSLEAKRAEVQLLEGIERELTLPPTILRFIQPGRDVWDAWEAAPVAARRELVRIVLSERGLGKTFIRPAPRTGPNQSIAGRISFRTSAMASVTWLP